MPKNSDKKELNLMEACKQGLRKRIITIFVREGLDTLNETNDFGDTPLYVASQYGHTEIVSELLERGALVNKTNNDGMTPLHIASQNNHQEVVLELINSKSEINRGDNDGDTPLFMAAINGNYKICEILINQKAQKAQINKINEDGRTPLSSSLSLLSHSKH